jgi:hypothetical protein
MKLSDSEAVDLILKIIIAVELGILAGFALSIYL